MKTRKWFVTVFSLLALLMGELIGFNPAGLVAPQAPQPAISGGLPEIEVVSPSIFSPQVAKACHNEGNCVQWTITGNRNVYWTGRVRPFGADAWQEETFFEPGIGTGTSEPFSYDFVLSDGDWVQWELSGSDGSFYTGWYQVWDCPCDECIGDRVETIPVAERGEWQPTGETRIVDGVEDAVYERPLTRDRLTGEVCSYEEDLRPEKEPPTIWVELGIETVPETRRIDPDGRIWWRFIGKPGAVALDSKFSVTIYDVAADGEVSPVPAEDVWFTDFSAQTDGGDEISVKVNGAAAGGSLPARQGWGSHGDGKFAWDLAPYGPERHLVFEFRMWGTDEATKKPFQNVACWDTKVTQPSYASDGVARALNADGKTYTVRPGDTVAQIAKSFESEGATIWSIMAANGLTLEDGGIVIIEPGQVLTVVVS